MLIMVGSLKVGVSKRQQIYVGMFNTTARYVFVVEKHIPKHINIK